MTSVWAGRASIHPYVFWMTVIRVLMINVSTVLAHILTPAREGHALPILESAVMVIYAPLTLVSVTIAFIYRSLVMMRFRALMTLVIASEPA